MNKKEFIKQWKKAKDLCRKGKLTDSLVLFNTLVPTAENLENIYTAKDFSSEEDFIGEIHYEKASFFGDLGAVLSDVGNFEEALKISEKSLFHKEQIPTRPTLTYIYFNRGLIYALKREYHKALKWVDKAIAEHEIKKYWVKASKMADYYAVKGEALYFLERYEESEHFFKKSIEVIDNKDFEPFYFLSKLYSLKNDVKKYNKYYKMYLIRKNKLSNDEFKKRTKYSPIEFE